MNDAASDPDLSAIRDVNLRLILSKDHEIHLNSMIRERFIANAGIAALWIAPPMIALLLVHVAPQTAFAYLRSNDWVGDTVFLVGLFLLFFLPVPLLVIPRNMWMARKYIRYYTDHADFLEKYNRNTAQARLRIERFAGFYYMFSLLVMMFIVFIWLASLIMVPRMTDAETPADVQPFSDREACLYAFYGNSEGKEAVARRHLSAAECNALLQGSWR